MMIAPKPVYLIDPECLLFVVDLREPGAGEILAQEQALWPHYTQVEVLDEAHAAVLRRPGWASEPAA